MDKLWILTEEKPKISVVLQIIQAYCNDFYATFTTGPDVKIRPVFNAGQFQYRYQVEGLNVSCVAGIIIKTVSGSSSFLDFLLFKQENEPAENGHDQPLMAIEETKTNDDESRNTGVYQRGAKFVFIEAFYPNVKLYMLYNEELECRNDKRPSDTSILGTNILLTLGVTIIGKDTSNWFGAFTSIDELVIFKSRMRRPPIGNVPIDIYKTNDCIYISGRLAKPAEAGNIGHDPNIGALSMISKCIRTLGWTGRIEITKHAVSQLYINKAAGDNKFLYICGLLNIELEGLKLPVAKSLPEQYWHYEYSSEKVASILLHIQCECCGLKEVYQNHAGCERGYFKTSLGELIALPKKDKKGNNLLLPDLVLWDKATNTIIMIEGKKITTLKNGLDEILLYDSIEEEYIKPYYKNCTVYRGVSIYGGEEKEIPNEGVTFYLSKSGSFFINSKAPLCIITAFSGL